MALSALLPIVDYPTLLAAIKNWTDRTDFDAVAPVLVGLAETRMNRDLRVREMLQRETAALSAGVQYVDLPDDMVELKSVRPITSPPSRPLTVMTLDEQQEHLSENIQTSQVPTSYAQLGNQISLSPQPTGAFALEIIYYGQIPTLTLVAPTNWIIGKWPDAYLYGSLVESAPYLRDDDRMQMWKDRFEEILNEIQAASARAEFSGGRMVNRRTKPIA